MTDRICLLCETHYNDDPYFREQPAHSSQKCLDILRYRFTEAEGIFREVERQLARAMLEYSKKEVKNGIQP